MRYILFFLRALVLGLAMLSVIAIGYVATMDRESRHDLFSSLFGKTQDENYETWHSAGGEELVRATSEHWVLADQIAKCYKISLSSLISQDVSSTLLLGVQPDGSVNWNTSQSNDQIYLTDYQRTLLTLSYSISTARGQAAASASSGRATMTFYQWVIVALGAATTVFVSIKSMSENANRLFKSIGVLAVVFSALGTMMSSMNSFIGPTDRYIRADRELHQLEDAHLELSMLAAQDAKLCSSFDSGQTGDPRQKRLADIAVKVREIVGVSGSAGTTPSTLGSGSGNSSSTAQK